MIYKLTKNEHIRKIGFLLRVYISYSSLKQYNEKLEYEVNLEKENVEI